MGDILLLDQQGTLLMYLNDSPRSFLNTQFEIHSITEFSRGFFVGGGTEEGNDGFIWIYEEDKNNAEVPYQLMPQSKNYPAIGQVENKEGKFEMDKISAITLNT